jgi:hypothetical protein
MPAKSRARKPSRAEPVAEPNPSWWERLASERVIFAGFALAVLLFYAQPLFDAAASIHWDAADEFFPAQKYFSDMLHAGKLPFWTPHLFSGMPLLADPQAGAWYPLNWPFFLIGVTPRSLMWETALHAFLALTGGYLLGRALSRSRMGAVFVGVFFAFSGFFAGHASHTVIFQAAALLPWLLWTGLRAARSPRWLPALAVVSGLTVLAGHFQTALYALFALACVLIGDFAVHRVSVRGMLQALLCAGAGAVLLSAVMTLPGLELTAQSIRAGADYRRDSGARLVPGALLTLVSPDHYGAVEDENYTGPADDTQFYFYESLLLVPLALLGLAASPRRWHALALLVPAAWYASGPPGGFYSLIAQLPGFRSVRAPIHIWFVAALGLALLAGAGLDVLRDRIRASWVTAALLVFVAGDLWYWNMDRNNLVYARASWEERYGGGQERLGAAAAPLLRDPLGRLYAPFDSPSFGPLDGTLNSRIEATFGYNPLELKRYTQYMEAAAKNPKLLDALAVTVKLNAANGALEPNPTALPRVYAPPVVMPAPAGGAALALLEPAAESYVEGLTAQMTQNAGARVRITEYTGDSYRVHYESDHNTFLRIAVPYFPGWRAVVDGKELPLMPADLALMGVIVPSGSHDLTLRYHSTWFQTGALISFLSWLAVLVWLFRARPRLSESQPI